jgi:hypothetical protein
VTSPVPGRHKPATGAFLRLIMMRMFATLLSISLAAPAAAQDNVARGLAVQAMQKASTAAVDPAARAASNAAPRRLLHVGTRTGELYNTATDGVNLQVNSQTYHWIPVASTGIRFAWGNFWINGGSAPNEADGTVDFSVLMAGFQILAPTSTSLQRVFFGGKKSTTHEIGALTISDPIGRYVPQGARIGIVAHIEAASSIPFWRGRTVVTSGGNLGQERAEQGVTVTDKTLSGGLTTTQLPTYVPLLILGTPANPLARSVALVGDSITDGGVNESVDADGMLGYFEKGLGKTVASAKFSRGGDKMSAWVNRRHSRNAAIFPNFTDVEINLGTNDLYKDNASLATLKAGATTLVQEFQAAGLSVTMNTLLPINPTDHSTTTGWSLADGSDQGVGTTDATRLAYNAWLLAGGLPGVRVIDTASAVTLAGNPSKWKAGYTADGVHPAPLAVTALAALFRPSLFSYPAYNGIPGSVF